MNLIFNAKVIGLLWWILAPLLVAKILLLISGFFLPIDTLITTKEKQKDALNAYAFPKVLQQIDSKKKEVKKDFRSKTNMFKNIVLKACYVEHDKKFIMIEEKGQSEFIDLKHSYKNAKLVEITMNTATFLKNGVYTKLLIEEEKNANEKKSILSILTQNHHEIQNEDYISIKRDDFKAYKSNLKEVLKDIRFYEIKKNQQFLGIALSFIRKGSLFDKMGLKNGDIITGIDNKRLTNMLDLLPYYNALENVSSLQIRFRRDQEIKEINYEIN